MPSRRSVLRTASALTALSLALPTTALADEPIQVVATFSILGDMVAQIGGDHIELTTLVGPGGDTHVYSPTPQDARAVSEAELMVINGLGFEGWLERLSEAAAFDGALIVATQGIEPIAYDEHGDEHSEEHAEGEHGHDHGEEHAEAGHDHDHGEEHAHDDHGHDHGEEHASAEAHDHDHGHDHEEHAHDDHDHGHGEEQAAAKDDHHDHAEHAGHDHHGHDHGAFDPHTWHSLELAVTYADNIAAGLAKTDPDNAGDYYANRAAYVAEIEALAGEVSAMMAAIPEDKRTIVTSHDAFQYFGEDYGLTFLAPQGLSTESEASAADVAALITQIREDGISAVFVETITDNRLIEQIADETGVSIGGTLYSGALSDEDGPAATYLDMMRHNAMTISNALIGS